mgnify:CR=1 FL=1
MNTTRKAGIGGVIALLIGAVVFTLIGFSDRKFAANCQTVQGQITEVNKRVTTERKRSGTSSTYRTKKKTRYEVTYSYTVDGKEYTEKDTMSSSRDVGPTVVYYLPNDPDDARLSKPSPMPDFLIAVGMLVGAVVTAFKTLIGGGGG